MTITDKRKDTAMSTLPGQNGQAEVYPAKPVQTYDSTKWGILGGGWVDEPRALDEGDLCGACGAWLPGGADPEVRALHLCEPESDEEGMGITDTITGQGVL